jgi:nitrate reductase gamma subunit
MYSTTVVQLLVGGILPYLALAVFLVGATYRLVTWQRLPQPSTMTLYPTQGSGVGPLIKEALFFPSLRKGDKLLWLVAWTFHATLALAFVGHVRVVTSMMDRALGWLGLGTSGIGTLSTIAGGVAGVLLLITIAAFTVRRILLARVREVSSVPDFVALLLLAAVIVSGSVMRFGPTHVDLSEARAWIASLLTFAPVVPANSAFLLHAFLAEMLLLYLAFSKLMHFGGFFLTFSLTKRSVP